MGVLDKFLDVMKLNSEDDEDDFYDEYDEEDEYEEEIPKRRSYRTARASGDDSVSYSVVESRSRERQPKSSQKVTPIRSSKKNGLGMEVCMIKPKEFRDACEVTQTLLDNRTVILNLVGMNVDAAQRIIDFSCGSAYAIGGSQQKISDYIFILTPANVDLSGDFDGGDGIEELINSFRGSGISTAF